jgi:hypothetical protein
MPDNFGMFWYDFVCKLWFKSRTRFKSLEPTNPTGVVTVIPTSSYWSADVVVVAAAAMQPQGKLQYICLRDLHLRPFRRVSSARHSLHNLQLGRAGTDRCSILIIKYTA